MIGKIKLYKAESNFGFIRSDQVNRDIYFSSRTLEVGYAPRAGDVVKCEIKQTSKGIEATRVQPLHKHPMPPALVVDDTAPIPLLGDSRKDILADIELAANGTTQASLNAKFTRLLSTLKVDLREGPIICADFLLALGSALLTAKHYSRAEQRAGGAFGLLASMRSYSRLKRRLVSSIELRATAVLASLPPEQRQDASILASTLHTLMASSFNYLNIRASLMRHANILRKNATSRSIHKQFSPKREIVSNAL